MEKAETIVETFPRAKTSIIQPAKNVLNKYEPWLDKIYAATGVDAHEMVHRYVKEYQESFKITVVE